MAIAFNLPGIPSQIRGTAEEAGAIPDLQQAMMQGFGGGLQMQYAPKQMAQDFLAKQLANKMSAIQAQYAEPEAQAKIRLYEAQRAKALQPSMTGLSPLEKAIMGQERIAKQYGAESPQAKLAQDYASRLAAGPAGMSIGIDKGGNITFSQGGPAGGARLKTGESYVYDNENKPVGIAAPPTPQEAKEMAGAASFNYAKPIMDQGMGPYLGKTGSAQIIQDIYNQESSPEAKERLINLVLAKKLATANAIKENATLGGSNTYSSFTNIKKSFSEIGVPENLDNFLSKFTFSKDILNEANDRFNKTINGMREAGESNVPARKVKYFEGMGPKPKSSEKPKEKVIEYVLVNGKYVPKS